MKNAVTALLGLAAAAEAFSVHTHRPSRALERRQNRGNNRGGNNGGNNNNNNGGNNNAGNNNAGNNAAAASATCLAANAVQTGSQSTGQNAAVAADGQVNSATYVYSPLSGGLSDADPSQ